MRLIAKILIIFLIILLFVFLNLPPFSSRAKNFFYLISSPFQKWLWQKGGRLAGFFEAISESSRLKKELEKEKSENRALLSQNLRLLELKKENKALREALGISSERNLKLILGQVVGTDISRDTIQIDKGSGEGIRKGLAVISQEKVLVGMVSRVFNDFSDIQLVSNRKSSFSAKIVRTSPEGGSGPAVKEEAEGIVKGEGNLRLYFNLIPKKEEIRKGDLIVTSALGNILPPGFLVGRVKKVINSDVQPFQTAEIEPAFDINRLEFLFVVKK